MEQTTLRYAIGVDLGGTKIEVGVVDEVGRIHLHQRLKTDVENGPEAVEKQILESIRFLQQQTGLLITGVGIGAAGQIDNQTGEILFAPNLKWHHVPLQAHLEKDLGIPVRILNDVRAITWGEWKYGAGRESQDVLCVFVGTGIGSGIISAGSLLKGCSNTCGEVGHMTIDFNGPLCTCGKKGCLEAFAGGWGIAARAQEMIVRDPQREASRYLLTLAKQQIQDITAKVVIQAYREGNDIAKFVFEQAEKALIAGMTSLVNILNPCRLILGGGVMDGVPELFSSVKEAVPQLALKAATQSLEIVKAQLGEQVGIIGSAAAIFDLLENKKKG